MNMLPEPTISQTAARNCQLCGKQLRGRIDKKYCNDYCRNSFNNHLKSQASNFVRNINNALGKNRRILGSFLDTNGETAKTNKEKMLQLGFQFKYLTHITVTKAGKTYHFCYDYGYLPLENDWFLIVKKKED